VLCSLWCWSCSTILQDWKWLEDSIMPKFGKSAVAATPTAGAAAAAGAAAGAKSFGAVDSALLLEVLETDIMARVVEDVLSYAKDKGRDNELPTFLHVIETVQKSNDINELTALQKEFEMVRIPARPYTAVRCSIHLLTVCPSSPLSGWSES
jgi:hypothetical protein